MWVVPRCDLVPTPPVIEIQRLLPGPPRELPNTANLPLPELKPAHGSRFSSAAPVVTSRGADAWSCAMSQWPLTFRKHMVARIQKPVVVVPLFYVPLSRLTLCADATSPPTVAVRSRIS
jgi:hypothetical protein